MEFKLQKLAISSAIEIAKIVITQNKIQNPEIIILTNEIGNPEGFSLQMEPDVRIELTTFRLQGGCSTS